MQKRTGRLTVTKRRVAGLSQQAVVNLMGVDRAYVSGLKLGQRTSLMASFANGIARDHTSVRAAITKPWSNGQTEGQITRPKLVMRQMYDRGKLDLLRARLIGAS